MNIIRVRTNLLAIRKLGTASMVTMHTSFTLGTMYLEMQDMYLTALQFGTEGWVHTTWKRTVPLQQTFWGDAE